MQSLWSRVAPTQSTCRCVPCLSTSAPGITSRAATAASKRRLRIGNSVTALYTSIFAAAALADARAKDKRRHEWAEKIAAVKEEVNELVNEEHRLLEAIQARRSRTLSQGALQKRSFTTWRSIPTPRSDQWLQRNPSRRLVHASRSADLEDDEEIVDEFQSGKLQEIVEDEGDPDDDRTGLEDGFFPEDMEVPKWLSDNTIRQKAIRKLAVKQLAIRLLLRESLAHNYSGLAMDHKADFDMPQLNYAELLSELNKLRRRIRLLKLTEGAYYDDLAHDLRVRSTAELNMERTRLDDEAARDVSLFLRNKMSIQELNLRLANNLLQSSDPDRPYFMKLMILAFTRSMQNDLSDLVLRTVLPHKFPLNSSLIISILTYYKKSKNLKAFDSFLKVLRGEGYPVDLGKLGFYKKMVVNGVEITIPPVASANPVIYTTLITAALRFEQLDRADAWLQAGRKHGFTDDFSTLYAYLKYYAKREDWQNGLYALRRSLAFLTGSTLHSDRHVERLIVHMVQLCDWCGKWDLADAMISAAIDSGFDWSSATTNQLDIQFGRDPRLHYWQKRVDKTTIEKRSRPAWEKSFTFAKLFGEQLEDLGLPEGQNPAAHWQRMVALHSREVLSAMSGPLRKLKDAKPTEPAPQPILSRDDFDVVEHVSSDPIEEHDISAEKKTPREEIDVLKSEVQELKRAVSKLRLRFRQKRVGVSTMASTGDNIEPPEGKQYNLQSATVY
ncbi:uncharacterized protein NFIA_075640 [Aspergillus fischeri NRRL 181]|uniref:Uncharacterized protein n=1 Tax=Neosartorya fischeri (strain ATCC 1020 / DSM 3700 / CBS 544.65 / FGSC A1164 / JCM 1740 / NRRL 181 / WB 181) TaxID=331117 RepID=A1DE27_NEOFI|nr:conserved hypothetical protein [Aspergillus fischeri NRRL 181]EAW17634.1 conserved hypothetical protein [Aspergillus fischeri NRRL 181]KAG2025549.1 hypothetical protein GB937_002805 [Aspergillus fischeri]